MIGSVTLLSQPVNEVGERNVSGRLEPAEVDREDQHEEECDQEAGDGEAEDREELNGAVDRSAAPSGEDAEDDREDGGEDDRADHQRQRHGEAAAS